MACADDDERRSKRQYIALLSEVAVTEIVYLLSSMGLVQLSKCNVPFLGHWGARHRGTDGDDGVQMDPVFLVEARYKDDYDEDPSGRREAGRAGIFLLPREVGGCAGTRSIFVSDCESLGSLKINTDLMQLGTVALLYLAGCRPCGLSSILGGAISADEHRHLDVWNTTQAAGDPDSSTQGRLVDQFHAVAASHGVLEIDRNLRLNDNWGATFSVASPACPAYSDFLAVVVMAIGRLSAITRLQHSRSPQPVTDGLSSRPRVVNAVQSYSDSLVDGGKLVHKDSGDIFRAVLVEIRRVLESVSSGDRSHEAKVDAVVRRFRASREMVGQRTLESAEAVRQLRLLRFIDGTDGLSGELKRLGQFTAKLCFKNYSLALAETEVQDRAAAAVGYLQYGRDSVLHDQLLVGPSAVAGTWRKILGVDKVTVAQSAEFSSLMDAYRASPEGSLALSDDFWVRLAVNYDYRVVPVPAGYLWDRPAAWATTTDYAVSHYSTVLHGRCMAEYSVPNCSWDGSRGDAGDGSVSVSSAGGSPAGYVAGRSPCMLIDTSIGDGGAASEPVCTMPVIVTLSKGHTRPSFQMVPMPCGADFMAQHSVAIASLLECDMGSWESIVRSRHQGPSNQSNGVRLLDAVSGNKVRDAALRSIWESYRTKAAQSSEKLRNTTICVCSAHPSAYFGVSFPFRSASNVLLRAADPVDMYSPGDPDLEQMDHLRAALRHLKTQRDHSAAQRATFPLRGTASEWDGLRVDSRPDLVLKLGVMPIPITSLASVIIPVLAADCEAGPSHWGAAFVRSAARAATVNPVSVGAAPQLTGLGQYSHAGEELSSVDHRLLLARVLTHAEPVLSGGGADLRQHPAVLRSHEVHGAHSVTRNESVFWSECGLFDALAGSTFADCLLSCFTLRRSMGCGPDGFTSAAWLKARHYAKDELRTPLSYLGDGLLGDMYAANQRAIDGGAISSAERAAGCAAIFAVGAEADIRAPVYWSRAVLGPQGMADVFSELAAPDLAGSVSSLRRSPGAPVDVLVFLFTLADFVWLHCISECRRNGGSDVYGLLCRFELPAFLPRKDFVGLCGSLRLQPTAVSFPFVADHPDNITLRTPLSVPATLLSGVPVVGFGTDEDICEHFVGGGTCLGLSQGS